MFGELQGFVFAATVDFQPYLAAFLIACVVLRCIWDWRRERRSRRAGIF